MNRQTGRVALVTGGAGGMGRAMAFGLARAGLLTVALDRRFGPGWEKSSEVAPDQVLWNASLDISVEEQCRRAVVEAVQRLGRIEILVNCAGVSMAPACPPGQLRVPFQRSNLEGYLHIMQINLLGTVAMSHHALSAMLPNGWGRIVNVTTSFDTMLAPDLSGYGASKAAVEALTSSWSKDLAGTGITCNSLVPGGPTDTGFFPLDLPRPSRLYSPEVMVAPLLWLVSDASDAVTGRRIVAARWDASRSAYVAEDFDEVGWPALARAAEAERGYQV